MSPFLSSWKPANECETCDKGNIIFHKMLLLLRRERCSLQTEWYSGKEDTGSPLSCYLHVGKQGLKECLEESIQEGVVLQKEEIEPG